jgi:hypothetical protein
MRVMSSKNLGQLTIAAPLSANVLSALCFLHAIRSCWWRDFQHSGFQTAITHSSSASFASIGRGKAPCGPEAKESIVLREEVTRTVMLAPPAKMEKT